MNRSRAAIATFQCLGCARARPLAEMQRALGGGLAWACEPCVEAQRKRQARRCGTCGGSAVCNEDGERICLLCGRTIGAKP